MSITIKNTYGRPHPTNPANAAYVTGAPGYRISITGTLQPTDDRFGEMVEWLNTGERNLHTRPEGYGLFLLESEEHAVSYFGPIEQVAAYQENPAAGFDQSQGVAFGDWPHGKAWDEFLPPSYWNREIDGSIADGVGLIAAFAHNAIEGAEVIVYEYEGCWSGGGDVHRMVTYHCTGCHQDSAFDGGHVHENRGPSDRRWAARQARQHITGAVRHGVGNENQLCQPGDGATLKAVNAFARSQSGPGYSGLPEDEEGYCAVKGPCSILRDIRTGTRPAPYGRR